MLVRLLPRTLLRTRGGRSRLAWILSLGLGLGGKLRVGLACGMCSCLHGQEIGQSLEDPCPRGLSLGLGLVRAHLLHLGAHEGSQERDKRAKGIQHSQRAGAGAGAGAGASTGASSSAGS